MKKKFGAFGARQFSLDTLVGGRPGTTIFQNPGGGGGGWGGSHTRTRPGPPPRVYPCHIVVPISGSGTGTCIHRHIIAVPASCGHACIIDILVAGHHQQKLLPYRAQTQVPWATEDGHWRGLEGEGTCLETDRSTTLVFWAQGPMSLGIWGSGSHVIGWAHQPSQNVY